MQFRVIFLGRGYSQRILSVVLTGCFSLKLQRSKSLLFLSYLLSILADLKCMVTILPLIFISPKSLSFSTVNSAFWQVPGICRSFHFLLFSFFGPLERQNKLDDEFFFLLNLWLFFSVLLLLLLLLLNRNIYLKRYNCLQKKDKRNKKKTTDLGIK